MPEPRGWTAFGEMALCDSSKDRVSPVRRESQEEEWVQVGGCVQVAQRMAR